jgi:CRISPR-associated Csx11 family protein
MGNSLQVLADHRDALLLAEVAAWLHMFGKLQEDFLKGRHRVANEIPKAVQINFPQLDALLKDTWFGSIWKLLPLGGTGTERLTPAQLIRTHEEAMERYTEGFRRLLIDAHGRGSGIEKGVLNRFALSHRDPVYLATSLGYESPVKLTDIQAAQQSLYSFLQTQLSNLKARNAKLDFNEWMDFRNKLLQIIQQSYSITVAETRRPLNDVTLLDQTAISVAFFKAALAQNLLLGKWKDPSQKKVVDKYHWCLLRVGLDGLAFWGNSTRIGDLLARKACIEDALNSIQILIEVTYPLGFEVYRDENSSVFIVPDISDLLAYTDKTQSLKEMVQAIAYERFSGETDFTLSLSSSTRNTLSFGRLVTEILPQPVPQAFWLTQQWQNREQDICSVCGLRPQGPGRKALSRKICDICEARRLNRSRQWIKNPSTTIWIDEVADTSGQLVLLVAHFDVADWLSGSSFNTVLSFDPASRRLSDNKQEPQEHDFDLHALIKDIQSGLIVGHEFEDNLLGYLVLHEQRGDSPSVQDFYDLQVSDTDLGDSLSISKPELLALSMIRQFPSFARISRVWKTAKNFWEDIESTFKTTIGEVNTRLRLQGSFLPNLKSRDTLGFSHTYEIKLGNINLSVVCFKEGEFLTVDNLHRTAVLLGAPEESRQNYTTATSYVYDRLRQSEFFEIEEPTEYGSSNTPLGSLHVENVTIEEAPYLPAISILTEPRTFMALVPADRAMIIAKAIKNKYEEEMSKVRDRFPLTLGIVFASRRTPLPAILDAGRRTLRQATTPELWKIKEVMPPHPRSSWPDEVSLTLEKDGQSLSMSVGTIMRDKQTEDVWYPYWCVEEDASGATSKGRERQFKGINGKEWVHICDLREGDEVYLKPSHFDFEFLDTAARRFEISYADNGRRYGSKRPARPYYLEQLDDFEKLWTLLSNGLETTQIENLIGIIEDRRIEWLADHNDEVFKQVVHDALNNANWRPSRLRGLQSEQFEQLYQAAVKGQLTDVVELYMRILKQRPEADKSQTKNMTGVIL